MKKEIKRPKYAEGGPLTGDPEKPVYTPAEQKIVDQYTKLGYTVTKGSNGQLQYKKNPGAAPQVQQQQPSVMAQPQTSVTQPVKASAPPQGAIPLPTADKASRKQYMDTFKQKYGLEHFGDIPLRVNETPLFGSRSSKQAATEEANKLGLDPALFYSSSMVEGQSGLYRGSAGQNAQGQDLYRGYTGDKDYPVSGMWAFGLDSFQDYYPELVRKGYLPKDFDKQWKNYDQPGAPEGSTSPSGQESTMFKTTDAGIQAKAAMMRAFYDESDAYAKKRGYNLTPEQRDYFALAHFNSGAHGYEMMDSYNKAGLLKNNDFLNSGKIPNVNVNFMYKGKQMSPEASARLHQQIYGNISPRIAAARGLKQEGLFAYGGSVPKKPYANGGEVGPGKGKKPKGKVDEGFVMPTDDGKGYILPNGDSVYPNGKIGMAPPVPAQGKVDEGFLMPGQSVFGGPVGTVDEGFLMPGQTRFGGPVGTVDEGFAMPIIANQKLRGVRQYAEGGRVGPGDEPKYSDQENYYRSSAKLAHYKTILNDKLKAKNPQAFGDFFKGLQPIRQAGNQQGAADYIQNSQYNDYLSADEVKKNLGADYQDYLNTIQQVNAYDVAQGRQPLYGTKETGTDLNNLNYGRRFASLALTPTYSGYNKTRGTSYNRSYTYDPKTKTVSFTETGDQKLRPDYLSMAPTTFKKGGKMPKYADGGPVDPPFTATADLTGGNNWLNTNDGMTPINPDGTPAIPLQNQAGTPVNQGKVVPLSQYYDVVNGRNGQKQLQGTGTYVNAQGQTTTPDEQQMLADQVSSQNQIAAMNQEKQQNDIETVATSSMAAINAFFQKTNAAQQDRSNRRKSIQQSMMAQMNPYLEGTGSQAIMEYGGGLSRGDDYGSKSKPYPSVSSGDFAGPHRSYPIPTKADAEDALRLAHLHGRSDVIAKVHAKYPELKYGGAIMEYKDGGSIHINPANKGKFNATKKRTGKTTEELTHSSNPVTRKRAIFAQNAAKWHHGENGLSLDGQDQDMQIIDGGGAKMISSSDHSNPMMEFSGRTHDEGGIGLQYGGNLAEVEDKEVGWIDQEGSLNIFGKLKLPGTNQTFRKAAQDIAAQEKKVDGEKSKYLNTLTNSNPANPYQESALSTSKIMFKSLDKQSKAIAQKKEALASYQNLILGMVDQGQKMAYGGQLPTMPAMPKYALGGAFGPEDPNDVKSVQAYIDKASGGKSPLKAEDFIEVSKKYGVPLDLMLAQATQESNFGTKGRAVRTHNIFNVGNTDDGTANDMGQWKKGLENYAKLLSTEYSKNGKISTQDLLNNGFTRTKDHARYATDPRYTERLSNILDEINPSNTYSYVNSYTAQTPESTNTGATDNTPGKITTTDIMANYKPINNPVGGNQEQVVQTKYGAAKRDATPFSDKAVITSGGRERGYQSPLDAEQIAPELISLATNQRQAVPGFSYEPDLQQSFDISYQLGRNENESTFKQTANIAEQTGNMDVLAQLAAQKYKADQQYNMQEIQGNAQQRLGTYAQNIATLNDAKVKNLALASDQQTKQTQADYNTRLQDMAALKSISAKVEQNKLENKTYNAYANLFQNYGFDNKGNVTFTPDKVARKFTAGEAQAFGMMAAQQGANSILNGDFSRQFTKVKNQDGSTTTTETLGTNKKIQEEYNALKKQGFDDAIIGNMLQARYPQTISGD